jgi:6-pyruvoyltetrahydropterin/6-carboxytetrahydropterin synthase
MYELVIESEFSAAHRLREYDGACENLHGHNWRVELVVGGEKLGPLGMLMDFRDLKKLLNDVLDRYDHTYINETAEFAEQNPTTENLAREVFRQCSARLPEGVAVRSVTVWESERAGARYTEPDGRTT